VAHGLLGNGLTYFLFGWASTYFAFAILMAMCGLFQPLYRVGTNAMMVVLFQVSVTKVTKRYLPLPVLAIGTFIYAVAFGSIVMGQGFWGFWLSFVVLTVGELMIMPTASAYVADLAPVDMRGRYMSSFSISQGFSRGIAPLFGGLLNDFVGPKAIWIGGGLMGLASAACFAYMARYYSPRKVITRKSQEKPLIT